MSDYDQTGYGDLPLFRTDDPQTSREAAVQVAPKLPAMCGEFVRCLRLIGEPSTAQEISMKAEASIRETVRKRAAECVERRLVTVLGTKKCSVTGNRATIYW